MNTRVLAAFALAAIVVVFFAVNILAGVGLRSTRVDLTEDHLYTLPVGARNIARNIDEPIRVRYYFSRKLASGRPGLTTYAQRVEDTLREFAAASGGKIQLEIIDPEPFTEQEDEATAAGVLGQPANINGDRLYFGMVATNAIDGREVVPYFDTAQERMLNYELSHRFYLLSHPDRPKVAVMSGLPISGTPGNQFAGEAPQPAWQIIQAMQSQYEVSFMEPDGSPVGEDIGVLLVVFPRTFSPATWYAIDQFIMRGGRAIFALDPFCMNYVPPEAMQNQAAIYTADRSAGFGPLGKAWGVDITRGMVAGDQVSAVSVPAPDRSGRTVSYMVYLLLAKDRIVSEDPVTASLGAVTVQAGGVLEVADASPLTVTPLLTTSIESMAIPVAKVQLPDPDALIRDFVPSGERITLGARLTGSLKSAFVDGPPAGVDGAGQLLESKEPAEIILLTDADMLSDPAWVRPIQIGGQVVGRQPFADNGSFLMNAVENLLGSSDLLSIRASASSFRPFTRVQELQRAAEQQYLAERERLQEQLQQAEAKINELLRGQVDTELMLTPELQTQLEAARETQVESRKNLREVQRKLDEDVERLDWQMRLINVALVPAAVALFAVALGVYRRLRRGVSRKRGLEGARV
jgi:gliding motility-associatede transport system auxiliary component